MTLADPDIEAFVAKVRSVSGERDELELRVRDRDERITALEIQLKELQARLDKITAALGQS